MKHKFRVFRYSKGVWYALAPTTMQYWIAPRMALFETERGREYAFYGKTPFEALYRCKSAYAKMHPKSGVTA